MAELGNAWISILPETSKIAPGIAQAIKGAESSAESTGGSFGGRFASGIGKVLKGTAVGVGAAAGASLGVGLTKGIGRLVAIEQAESKLKGLGHSTQSVAGVMDSALSSVKGTAYGLGDAASVAAQMVASGIQPGEELTRTLTTVGDVAAISGREIGDMGLIFGSVAARGKLQGDDMLQLMSSGIPVLQLLAEETGRTSAEISEMVSKGEIDFATFESAMRNGMGGAALEAGNTVRGAIANVGAAAGRVGAQIAEPFYNQVAPALTVATAGIDELGERVGPAMERVNSWIVGTGVPSIQQFAREVPQMWDGFTRSQLAQDSLDRISSIFQSVRSAASEAAPAVGQIVSSLGRASAALGISGWQVLLSVLQSTASIAESTLVPALSTVADLMEAHPGLVTAGLAAWTGFQTIPGMVSKVSDVLSPLTTRLSGLRAGFSDAAAGGREIQGMFADQGASIGRFDAQVRHLAYGDGSLAQMATAYANAASAGGNFARAKGAVAASMTGLRTAGSSLISFLGGPWAVGFMAAGAVVTGVANEWQKATRFQDLMAESSTRSAAATSQMWEAFAEGQGVTQIATAGIQSMRTELAQIAALQPGSLSVFSAGLRDIGGWFQGDWEGAGTRVYKAQKSAADGAAEAKTSFDELGVSNQDLSAAITASEQSLAYWEERLRSTSNGGEAAIEQLREQRAQYESVKAAMEGMSPGALTAAEAVEVLADQFASAEDKASAFQRMMLELSGVPMELEEATAQYSETLDELTGSMQAQMDAAAGLGPAMLDAAGGLDVTNANSRELRESLMQLGQDATTAVIAGRDIGTVMSEAAPVMEAMAAATGLPIEKIQELAGVYGLLPETLELAVMVDSNQAYGELLAVKTALDQVPAGREVQLVVKDAAARAALEEIGYKVTVIDETTGTVSIEPRTEDASARLDELLGQVQGLDAAHAEPTAGLNTDLFLNRNTEALKLLGALDSEHAEPTSSLNNSKLNTDASTAKSTLDRLAAEHAQPTASLNNRQLIVGVDNSRAYLNSLPTERVINIYTNHWTRNMGVQHTGGMQTGGRYVPAYAVGSRHSGYQLPSTGPGTEITDGFLAFDRWGMPSARLDKNEWVVNGKSSEKYNKAISLINQDHPSIRHLQKLESGGRAGVSASELLKFARGEMVNGQQASRSLDGALYAWAGINWGDCSAAISGLARFAKGVSAFGGRFATGNQGAALDALGFAPGIGNPATDFSIGWYHGYGPGGGHTSGTIAGTNVEMGGGNGGNGKIGGGAVGANHPQYNQHRHLKLRADQPGTPTSTTSGSLVSDPGVGTGADGEGGYDGYRSLRRPTSRSTPSGSTQKTTEPTGPTSISEVFGIGAAAFASGIVSDALGVFGIPDSPPALQAYRQWQDAQNNGGTTEGTATTQSLEEALADAEDDLDAAQSWLEASETRLANLPATATETTRQATSMRVDNARAAVAEAERAVAEAESAYVAGPSAGQANTASALAAAKADYDTGNPASAIGQLYQGLAEQVIGKRNIDVPNIVDEEFKRLLVSLGVKKFRGGGLVVGPGTGTSDDVPILASNQEFVVNAAATARNRGLLEAINAGQVPATRGETHYHIHGSDNGDLIRRLEARELAATMQHLGG